VRAKQVTKAVVAGLSGVVAVLGPLTLDRVVTARARVAFQQYLGVRLGGQVTIEDVRLEGVLTVTCDRLSVRWPGPGVARLRARSLRLRVATAAALRLEPALDRVGLSGGRLRWIRPRPVAELRRLLGRLSGASASVGAGRGGGMGGGSGKQGGGRRVALRMELERVTIEELGRNGRTRGPGGPGEFAGAAGLDGLHVRPRRLNLEGARLVRRSDGSLAGRIGRGRITLTSGHGAEVRRLRWRGRQRAGGVAGAGDAGGVWGGVRTHRIRVQRGRVWGRGGFEGGARFRLAADEVAPDLLQMRLESGRTVSGRASRVRLNLDGIKRSIKGRVRIVGFPLQELSPWLGAREFALRRAQGGLAVHVSCKHVAGCGIRGELALRGIGVHYVRLAHRPVRWPTLRITGNVRLDPARRRVRVQRMRLQQRGVTLRLDGWAQQKGGGLQVEGTLEMPHAPCHKALSALPEALVPKISGIRLAGALGGRIRMKVDSRDLDDLDLEVAVQPAACRVVRDAPHADVVALRRPFAFVSRPPGWRPTRLVMGPENDNWVPYSRLGRNVVAAFLAAEDRRFFEHEGFDLENIRRALAEDLRRGELAKGASSISQQVVKNVFLSHRRSLSRKLQEVVLTWRLEQVIEKRRILEIYLNLVEMGPGLFGVRAAARHYFGKEPHQLDPLQAAHLAAITPNPRHYFERFRSGRAGMDWLLHLRWLLYQMHAMGWLGRKAYEHHRQRDLRLISRPSSGPSHASRPPRRRRSSRRRRLAAD
jgi:monofunctional biosynthetic peptidoglycan transglycosylase